MSGSGSKEDGVVKGKGGRPGERCGGVGDDAIIPQCRECDDVMRWGHNHNVIGAGTGTRCAGKQHGVAPLGSANRLQRTGLGGQCYSAPRTLDTPAACAGLYHAA